MDNQHKYNILYFVNTNYVKNIKSGDYLVMEISDHQLCDMYDFKTNTSIITNIYECHTDFHDSPPSLPDHCIYKTYICVLFFLLFIIITLYKNKRIQS